MRYEIIIENIAIEILLVYLKNTRLSNLLSKISFHIQKSYNIIFLS